MVGNKWYKCDLHLHTPASNCFQDKNVTVEQWVNRCIEQKISCVAITDHNTGQNIDEYKEACLRKGIVAFPGVELTYGDMGIHLLVLFSIEATTDTVNEFLTMVGIKAAERAISTTRSDKSFNEIKKIAKVYNALLIPAHIDEYNGLGEIKPNVSQETLADNDILAVQVVNKDVFEMREKQATPDDKIVLSTKLSAKYNDEIDVTKVNKWLNVVKFAEEKNKSMLTFSDNPDSSVSTKHGLWGIGQRYTWIKMSSNITLESLKEALYYNEDRICNDFNIQNLKNPKSYLKKIQVEDTKLTSEVINIEFSPNFTTIIGGRGTGKSAILRFLVYGLGKEKDFYDFGEIDDDLKKFLAKDSGVLDENSKVDIELVIDGIDYRFVRDEKKLEIFKGDEKISNDFGVKSFLNKKIDIYLQKQIFNISSKQNSIRNIFDDYNSKVTERIKNEISRIENQLQIDFKEIQGIKLFLRKESQYKLKEKNLLEKLEKVTNESVQSYYRANEENTLNKRNIYKNKEVFEKKIDSIITNTESLEVSIKTISNEEIDSFSNELEAEFKLAKIEMMKITEKLKITLENYYQKISESEWEECNKKIQKEYSEIVESFSIEETHMMRDVNDLNTDIKEVEAELKEIERKKIELEQKESEYNNSIKELENENNNLFEARNEFLKENFADIDGLTVTINKQVDFENYINKMREIMQKKDTYNSIFEELQTRLTRREVTVNTISNEFFKKSGDVSEDVFKDKRFINVLNALSDDQKLKLKLLVPEDEIKISLYVNEIRNNVPLNDASAGQKTSAILALILAYGETSLILDQPEDDLDSQLINSLIVNSVKKGKKNRQIIIVTHNANIPVNADSEWVVTMNDTKKIGVKNTGSVDDINIKEEICRVMEGGEKAFKSRAYRYGYIKD